MINIVCVLKTNPTKNDFLYSEEWVDKLYNQVNRNLKIPFEFICFSNVQTKYKTIPLISNSVGFWNKLEIFRSEILKGPTLYLDLDVVICKDITQFLNSIPNEKFLMVREPYQEIVNSSIMYWNGDYSFLFNKYINNKEQVCEEYKKVPRYGDQSYISEHVNFDLIDNYVPQGFIGWRHHKLSLKIDDPTFLIFTSKHQKPSNNIDLQIVKENWR